MGRKSQYFHTADSFLEADHPIATDPTFHLPGFSDRSPSLALAIRQQTFLLSAKPRLRIACAPCVVWPCAEQSTSGARHRSPAPDSSTRNGGAGQTSGRARPEPGRFPSRSQPQSSQAFVPSAGACSLISASLFSPQLHPGSFTTSAPPPLHRRPLRRTPAKNPAPG